MLSGSIDPGLRPFLKPAGFAGNGDDALATVETFDELGMDDGGAVGVRARSVFPRTEQIGPQCLSPHSLHLAASMRQLIETVAAGLVEGLHVRATKAA